MIYKILHIGFTVSETGSPRRIRSEFCPWTKCAGMKKTIKKSYTMRNMAMALAVGAATSMMLATVEPAFAFSRNGFNVSARTFLVELHHTARIGQHAAILGLIQRLRSMKVNSISLDGQTIALSELERLVIDGSQGAIERLGEIASLAQTQRVRFEVGNTQVASLETQTEFFPTSSSG